MLQLKVRLGAHAKTGPRFRELLKLSGVRVSEGHGRIFDHADFKPYPRSKTVEIALLSARELGLEKRSTYYDIFFRGVNQGYQPCPAETAVQVCLQLKEQVVDPMGKKFTFAMEPVGELVFEVDLAPRPWLASRLIRVKQNFHPDELFAFIRPSAPRT